jgi:peptidoglycan/LPS O-acetylase OafA/YrhL
MIPWMAAKLAEIGMLVQGGLVVAAVLFIGHVWWKTKALVPTVGAMLLALAVLWGTANIQWFQKAVLEQMAGR